MIMSTPQTFFADQIQEQIQSVLNKIMPGWNGNWTVNPPARVDHGDYSTNLAMVLFKDRKTLIGKFSEQISQLQTPFELAEYFAQNFLSESITTRYRVEILKPGFINFYFKPEFLKIGVEKLLSGEVSLIEPAPKAQKAVVEYSSPNIAKPFTVGHLRSTIIGDAVANLLEATGWTVYRDNHLGDWGTQFGKQITAILKYGSEEQIAKSPRPVKELVELYVKFHKEAEAHPELEVEARLWFKKLEDGDPEARRLWLQCIEWSLKEFAQIYQRLGVKFTENDGKGYGESFFEKMMTEVIEELTQKGLLKESQGAKVIFFPDDQLPPLMVVKQDGATLYATRDLATDHWRLEHYGDDIVVINEVGAEQTEYFRQLYLTEQLLNWYKPGQRVHVKHGLYRFKDQKMSTRKGNVIWLEDVLSQAVTRAHNVSDTKQISAETAEIVGIGALKWNDLKRSSHLDVVFDWDEILSMEGNSGPYLQYSYARGRSLLRKAEEKGLKYGKSNEKLSLDQLQPADWQVIRQILLFNETVHRAAKEYAPHHLSTYLYELAQAFNTWYSSQPILQTESDKKAVTAFRLQIVDVTTQVLKKGLNILGIQAPEQM